MIFMPFTIPPIIITAFIAILIAFGSTYMIVQSLNPHASQVQNNSVISKNITGDLAKDIPQIVNQNPDFFGALIEMITAGVQTVAKVAGMIGLSILKFILGIFGFNVDIPDWIGILLTLIIFFWVLSTQLGNASWYIYEYGRILSWVIFGVIIIVIILKIIHAV